MVKTSGGYSAAQYPASRKRPKPAARGGLNPVAVGVIAIIVLLAAAMGYLTFRPKEGERQGAACALLVDRSGSSTQPTTQQSYEKLAAAAINGCRSKRATLSIFWFDNSAAKFKQANGNQPFALYRPKAGRKSTGEARVNKAIDQAQRAIASVFSSPRGTATHGSDIITALASASQELQQEAIADHVDKKYLVILTDGYQSGNDLAMSRYLTTSGGGPSALLAKTRGVGLIPTLSGVNVSFVGVQGGAAGSSHSQTYEDNVRTYWKKLVQSGGGQVCVYNVEATSLPGQC